MGIGRREREGKGGRVLVIHVRIFACMYVHFYNHDSVNFVTVLMSGVPVGKCCIVESLCVYVLAG